MSLLLNRAKVSTATTGTGTVTLGSAVAPYQTWAAAQAGTTSTTRRYSYLIEDGTAWEIGEGIYDETANTLTRVLVASSSGSLLSLTGSATVACVAKSADTAQVIEKKVFAGGETSFTFSDIPQDFTTLELEVYGRLQVAAAAQNLLLTVNGLATAIYDFQRQYGQTTTNATDAFSAVSNLKDCFAMPGTSFPAGQAGGVLFKFYGYSGSTLHKVFSAEGLKWPNSTTTYTQYLMKISGGIRLTSAITSIESGTIPASGQMAAGSYAVLRGIP